MKRFVYDQQLQRESVSEIRRVVCRSCLARVSKVRQISSSHASYHPLGPLTEESFDKEDCDDVASLFLRTEFSNYSVKCLRIYRKFKALTDGGRLLGSLTSRSVKSSNVFARCEGSTSLRACQIQYFCEVKLSVVNDKGERQLVCRLVAVKWHQRHPEQSWQLSCFVNYFEPWRSFILLEHIRCLAATCVNSVKFNYGEESVLCVVPVERHSHMLATS